MRVFQVSLPHFYQIDTQDQSAVIGQMVSLFAGPLQHCRFLTFVTPASLERLERERRRLAMSLTDDWSRRGLMEEVRMISSWAQRGAMRKTRHYLIDFNDKYDAFDGTEDEVELLKGDLAKLGQIISIRGELEDQILEALARK